MPRSEARIRCRVWQDDDFTALSVGAQHVYLMVLSQGDLSLAGVVAYVPHRWVRLAADLTAGALRACVDELIGQRFVFVDEDTGELWIRSFVKWDGVLKSRKTRQAMWTAYHAVHSREIRQRILGAVPSDVLTEALEAEWVRHADLPRPSDTPSWHSGIPLPSTAGNTDSFSDSNSFPVENDDVVSFEAKRAASLVALEARMREKGGQ